MCERERERVCVCVCVCVCATSARSCDQCDGSSGDDMEGVCDYGKSTNVGICCVCVCMIPGVLLPLPYSTPLVKLIPCWAL